MLYIAVVRSTTSSIRSIRRTGFTSMDIRYRQTCSMSRNNREKKKDNHKQIKSINCEKFHAITRPLSSFVRVLFLTQILPLEHVLPGNNAIATRARSFPPVFLVREQSQVCKVYVIERSAAEAGGRKSVGYGITTTYYYYGALLLLPVPGFGEENGGRNRKKKKKREKPQRKRAE